MSLMMEQETINFGNKSIDIVNDGGQNNHPWLDNTGNWSGQLWKLTTIRKI
jgi:hypothetical protein